METKALSSFFKNWLCLNSLFDNMWPVRKVKLYPASCEWWAGWGRVMEKTVFFLFFFPNSSKIVTAHTGDLTKLQPGSCPSPLASVHRFRQSRASSRVHKLTSRTSVGVLDSCCSLVLFAALAALSCWYCWPCCRLLVSTRSICSWHALKQSCNREITDVKP